MYRRVLSLMLVPCALLTQSVALVHAHCGHDAGHDYRPHVHVRTAAKHEHCRHHDSCPDEPTAPPADHDSDAVYLTVTDLVSGRLAGFDGVTADALSLHTAAANHRVEAAVAPARPAWVHPPPNLPPCPLYVRHLALLI